MTNENEDPGYVHQQFALFILNERDIPVVKFDLDLSFVYLWWSKSPSNFAARSPRSNKKRKPKRKKRQPNVMSIVRVDSKQILQIPRHVFYYLEKSIPRGGFAKGPVHA
jgi:hypothetical protein